MSRFLITGIAGFVGSHLASTLLDLGHDVRGIDDLSSGRLANLDGIESQIDFRQASVLDTEAVQNACRGVDFVLHHAAIASVPRSVAVPPETNDVNVTGTLIVLLAARDQGVRRVVYASSSACYGDFPVLPKTEDVPIGPLSPYGVSKAAGELYARAFHATYGLETVSLRYFNIFGPRQDASSPYSGVLARFITSLLAGKPPVIFGDGEQTRDLVYVSDVVRANLLACDAPPSQTAGQYFNIGSGHGVSVNRLFAMVRDITNPSIEPLRAEARPGDIRHSVADNSRAREALGYVPAVSVQRGIEITVDWYRSRPELLELAA
jgi:nucleoside-diphosphate-sugar epimerase